jgi:5-hydroxyisourate hydrolase
LGKLTTHVLDTAHGRPAAGVAISLFRIRANDRQCLCTTRTNADGRCDHPLVEGSQFQAGTYELEFGAGEYFRTVQVSLPDPPFLNVVVLRFGVADASQNFHVPLVVSPWSYSTYRGS